MDEVKIKLELIEDGYILLRDAIRGKPDGFIRETGFSFEDFDSFRDPLEPNTYVFIFKINDKYYRCDGYYDSWEGVSLDSYDVKDFYRTELRETIIKEWKPA